jgi:hypothetical protein
MKHVFRRLSTGDRGHSPLHCMQQNISSIFFNLLLAHRYNNLSAVKKPGDLLKFFFLILSVLDICQD